MAPGFAGDSARGRRLCAAAALPRLRRHRRRRPTILPDVLVVARFPRRTRLRALLDPVADGAARRTDRMRCLSGQRAAVRRGTRRSCLWTGRAHGRLAAEIWAADGTCAVDGAADDAAARRAGRYGRHAAGAGAVAPLAAVVARLQSGGADGRRTVAHDGRAARSSPVAAGQADRIAARQGAARARADRRRGICAGRRCPRARGRAPYRAGRRCPRQRRDVARRGKSAAAQRRGAGIGAHLGAGGSRRADDKQHI